MKHCRVKLDVSLFCAGFILSVIFVLFILGMLLVNYHISQAGTPDYTPLFSTENRGKLFTIRIVGEEIYLDREIYQELEPALQKLSVFLPAGARAYVLSWSQLRAWMRGEGFGLPPVGQKGGAVPGYSGA